MEFMLLRGARITQQLDEASTVTGLEQNISTAFPNTTKRQHATGEVAVQNIQYIPYIGTKMLHVKSSTSSNSHQYQQVIQFNNVVFEGEDTGENATFTATDGTETHVQPLDLNQLNVRVRCNCLDFYHRFANWNAQDKSLVGRSPNLYIRKTSTRPPVNPLRLPGMCKHLLRVVQELQTNGLVK